MISLFFILFSLFALTNADNIRKRDLTSVLDDNDEWKQFSNFQERFSKKYLNIDELETRFKIFRENFRSIITHNLDHTQNFTMGINQFTDLTSQEFKDQFASGYKSLQSFGCGSFSSHVSSLPEKVDWATTPNVVNAVRDQGQCGSCWAFATTANAESVWALYSGKLLDLSEEFLVDCATGVGYFNMGCNGGNPDSAFKYMINKGQCYEASYPYTSGVTKTAGECQKCTSAGVKFSSCSDVLPKDQVALKAAVAKQPVVIAIEADTRYFQSYSSGVLTDGVKCGTTLDHAVEIVGYGTENGIDYWKVRNSWGSSWGLNGYVLIQRTSSTNDIGVCGIAAEPSFLVV
jgi:cathepsin L